MEKCRLKNGRLKEPFKLELVPIQDPLPPSFMKAELESKFPSASATAILDILLLAFASFFDNFDDVFDSFEQTGQAGSNLSASAVMFSKHSE